MLAGSLRGGAAISIGGPVASPQPRGCHRVAVNLDARLAVLLIVVVVAAILLLGSPRLPGGTPAPTDCGTRNPAGHVRGCADASQGD